MEEEQCKYDANTKVDRVFCLQVDRALAGSWSDPSKEDASAWMIKYLHLRLFCRLHLFFLQLPRTLPPEGPVLSSMILAGLYHTSLQTKAQT